MEVEVVVAGEVGVAFTRGGNVGMGAAVAVSVGVGEGAGEGVPVGVRAPGLPAHAARPTAAAKNR